MLLQFILHLLPTFNFTRKLRYCRRSRPRHHVPMLSTCLTDGRTNVYSLRCFFYAHKFGRQFRNVFNNKLDHYLTTQ